MAARTPPRGRAELIEHLVAMLRPDGPRLVTLTGLPGVGKTTVASYLAAMLPDLPSVRQLLPPGGSVPVVDEWTRTEARSLVATLAATLRLSPPDPSDDAQVLAAVDAVPRVIVVDDPPTDDDSTAALGSLLDACGRLRIVVTRRAPTRLPGEAVVRIEPLDVSANPTALPDPWSDAAIGIFRDVSGAAGARLHGDVDEISDIAAICRLVGGLPLGITLAASRTVAFSPAEIRRSLETEANLEHLLRDGRGPAGTRRTMDWTVGLLQDRQRALLHSLTVFRSPVSAAVIDEVCADGDGTVDADLASLSELHMVEVDRTRGTSRFRLHPLVRSHLGSVRVDHIPDRSQRDELQTRHRAWAVRFASRSTRRHLFEPRSVVLDDVDSVEVELLEAIEGALGDRDTESAAVIALALAPLWFHRIQHVVAGQVIDRVCDTSVRLPPSLAAPLLAWAAAFQADRSSSQAALDRARAQLVEACELAERCVDEVQLAVLERAAQTSWLFDESGDAPSARAWCERARGIAGRLGADHSRTRLETIEGVLARQAGDFASAERWGVRALGSARRLDDPALVVIAAGLLSTLPGGPVVEAPPGDDLVSLARSTGDRRTLAWIEPTVAWRAIRDGDLPVATELCTAQLERSLEAGAWAWCDAAVLTLVRIAAAHGDLDRVARLHGVVADRLDRIRRSSPARVVDGHLRVVDDAVGALGAQRFNRLVDAMSSIDQRDALAHVLDECAALSSMAARGEGGVEPPEGPEALGRLSPRELEVVRLLVAGRTNKEIAGELSITAKTVMHHTSSIYRKLGVRGRAEAAALGARHLAGTANPSGAFTSRPP